MNKPVNPGDANNAALPNPRQDESPTTEPPLDEQLVATDAPSVPLDNTSTVPDTALLVSANGGLPATAGPAKSLLLVVQVGEEFKYEPHPDWPGPEAVDPEPFFPERKKGSG